MAYLLHGLLARAAARQPQRPAVSSDGRVLTYAELDQLSNKVARRCCGRAWRLATGWGYSHPSRQPRSSPCTGR